MHGARLVLTAAFTALAVFVIFRLASPEGPALPLPMQHRAAIAVVIAHALPKPPPAAHRPTAQRSAPAAHSRDVATTAASRSTPRPARPVIRPAPAPAPATPPPVAERTIESVPPAPEPPRTDKPQRKGKAKSEKHDSDDGEQPDDEDRSEKQDQPDRPDDTGGERDD